MGTGHVVIENNNSSPVNIRLVQDLEEAKKLWNKFSPQKTLWDRWETVFSFYNSDIHEIKFFVLDGKEGEKGLFPLVRMWEK